MILVASQRGGAKQLGLHLLCADENEHVEVHEISGFVSGDVVERSRRPRPSRRALAASSIYSPYR